MGSGITAGCAVRKGMGLKTKVGGGVSEGAPAYALSFEAGRKIEARVTTAIADGMACRPPEDEPLEIIRPNVDNLILVSDREVRRAIQISFTYSHNPEDGAQAASFAA